VSRVLLKGEYLKALDRAGKPFSGIVWQDLDEEERYVKEKDIETGRPLQVDVSKEPFRVALAPTPKLVALRIGQLTKSISKKSAPIAKPKPLPRPILKPPLSGVKTRKKKKKGLVRVYLADETDFLFEELYGFLAQTLDLLTLSQPAHARRRQVKVSSRN